jgi:hypothetical protein
VAGAEPGLRAGAPIADVTNGVVATDAAEGVVVAGRVSGALPFTSDDFASTVAALPGAGMRNAWRARAMASA